jgi:hypothetical protein
MEYARLLATMASTLMLTMFVNHATQLVLLAHLLFQQTVVHATLDSIWNGSAFLAKPHVELELTPTISQIAVSSVTTHARLVQLLVLTNARSVLQIS